MLNTEIDGTLGDSEDYVEQLMVRARKTLHRAVIPASVSMTPNIALVIPKPEYFDSFSFSSFSGMYLGTYADKTATSSRLPANPVDAPLPGILKYMGCSR